MSVAPILEQRMDAALRVERVLYLSLGAGGLLYLALAFGDASAQANALAGGWGTWFYGMLAGLCSAFVITALFATRTALTALGTALAASFAVALLLWVPTEVVTTLPDNRSPWPLSMIAVATTAVAISWGPRVTWIYLIALCLLGGAVRVLSDTQVSLDRALQNTIYMLLISTVFAALVLLVRRAGREQGAMIASARDAAAGAAAADARTAQRARFAALVHDDVLSTLIVASRATPEMQPTVRQHARAALERVAELERSARRDAAGLRLGAELAADEVAARLRTACALPGGPPLVVEIDDAAPVPEEVVDALGEALAEAVRNCLRHAPGAHCDARARLDPRGVSVTVTDDGVGFDPRRVPAQRLGLRVSVLERMAIAGGKAEIASKPGHGTRVTVAWHPPQAPVHATGAVRSADEGTA